MKKQRNHQRHATIEYFSIYHSNDGSTFGRVIDLSEKGMLVLRSTPVESGRSWDLILDPGKVVNGVSSVRLAAQVRWCRPSVTPEHFECGIQIKAISEKEHEVLRYLSRHSAFQLTH